jgi:exonuclease VII small subunit
MLDHLEEIAAGCQTLEEETADLNSSIDTLSPGDTVLREGLSPIEAARYQMAEYL